MKKWLRLWVVVCPLLAVVLALPVATGCNREPDPRDNPDFQESNLDPSNVKMEPLTKPAP